MYRVIACLADRGDPEYPLDMVGIIVQPFLMSIEFVRLFPTDNTPAAGTDMLCYLIPVRDKLMDILIPRGFRDELKIQISAFVCVHRW